jgi:hypothetical protein
MRKRASIGSAYEFVLSNGIEKQGCPGALQPETQSQNLRKRANA